MATCTITGAVTGTCGEPAVLTFRATTGELLGECAKHALRLTVTPRLAAGTTAMLRIHGLTKAVTVLAVYRTRAKVLVPTGRGPVERVVGLEELA